MSSYKATEKQIGFIISLYNRVHGTSNAYLDQCTALCLKQREKKGGMTKTEASAIIDQLKKETM